MNIEEHDQKIKEGDVGAHGISEKVLAELVNRSKKAGITIYAHIQTPEDFATALKYGISHFAHMPGYGGGLGKRTFEELAISDSLLLAAAGLKSLIVPTVSFAKYYSYGWNGKEMALDTAQLRQRRAFLGNQLERYVKMAMGVDQYNPTPYEELDEVIALNIFGNKRMIQILTSSSKLVFPNKKVGSIAEGYEGSFLVLGGNPLENMAHIKNIELGIKDGLVVYQNE